MSEQPSDLEVAVAQLAAVPSGETLWIGLTGFMKHRRGDWVEIASGPVRFTSRDLVTMMAARHEPPAITKLLQQYHAEEILRSALTEATPENPARCGICHRPVREGLIAHKLTCPEGQE